MSNLKAFFLPVIATVTISTAGTASAQAVLPGRTLSLQVAADTSQPMSNAANVAGNSMSPACPYLGWSFAALQSYARSNQPAIFRAGLALRAAGVTETRARDLIEELLCTIEGFDMAPASAS